MRRSNSAGVRQPAALQISNRWRYCRGCDRKEIDWGGCRCQAFAITGDAARTDPACALSADHEQLVTLATTDAVAETGFVYRSPRTAKTQLA